MEYVKPLEVIHMAAGVSSSRGLRYVLASASLMLGAATPSRAQAPPFSAARAEQTAPSVQTLTGIAPAAASEEKLPFLKFLGMNLPEAISAARVGLERVWTQVAFVL